MPESFKVLIKELQSLALDIKVLDSDGEEVELGEYAEEEEYVAPLSVNIEGSEDDATHNAASSSVYSDEARTSTRNRRLSLRKRTMTTSWNLTTTLSMI